MCARKRSNQHFALVLPLFTLAFGSAGEITAPLHVAEDEANLLAVTGPATSTEGQLGSGPDDAARRSLRIKRRYNPPKSAIAGCETRPGRHVGQSEEGKIPCAFSG